ncbi:MAG: hypothetical protein R2695_02000 [Acidimicrobiales bacterium]
MLTVSTHDAGSQTIRGQHVDISADGIRMRPWALHYLTPAQLDSLAETAGLTLEHRHRDWAGGPFDPAGDAHVSVYRLAR